MSIRVLIVEDEAPSAMFLQMKLTRSGFEISDVVSTAAEAIASVERNRPDLILMDINLPGEEDGIHAAEKINEKGFIPIIFLTGYDDAEILSRAEAVNPIGIFSKPVTGSTINDLIKRIQTACS